MKKTLKNIKEGNMPTTVQRRLLHWLTQLELSGGMPDGSANLARLSHTGGLADNDCNVQEIKSINT